MLELITKLAAATGLCLLAVGVSAKAQDVEVDAPGTTVRVGPDKGVDVAVPGVEVRVGPGAPAPVTEPPVIEVPAAKPSYYIGLQGGDVSDPLRLHLGLEGAGVIVRQVVPGSPAD